MDVKETEYDGRIVLREYTRPAEYHKMVHVRPDGTEEFLGEYVRIKGDEMYPALCRTVKDVDWLPMGEGAARSMIEELNVEAVHNEGRE